MRYGCTKADHACRLVSSITPRRCSSSKTWKEAEQDCGFGEVMGLWLKMMTAEGSKGTEDGGEGKKMAMSCYSIESL